ncbi:UNVERIFIED_CONTAM: hypothetical protein K2H54_056876 [Gekko kuhli]
MGWVDLFSVGQDYQYSGIGVGYVFSPEGGSTNTVEYATILVVLPSGVGRGDANRLGLPAPWTSDGDHFQQPSPTRVQTAKGRRALQWAAKLALIVFNATMGLIPSKLYKGHKHKGCFFT